MKRSKLIMSIVVGLVAIFIIWGVGFYSPVPQQAEEPNEVAVAVAAVAEPNLPGEIQQPIDANELVVASDANEPGPVVEVNEPKEVVAVAEPNESAEPNEPMEYVNLKDVQMKDIVQKLADWTGKAIIPTDESLKQKVTIYATKRMPRSEALSLIYSALHTKGYVAEHTDGRIYIKPLVEAKLGEVPTIAADYPLAMVENKDQVVQKFFSLKDYSPSQMAQIIVPLVGEHGYVSADEGTGSLLVIDTVRNLMRIGRIIEQFDVVGAENTITKVFEVRHGDPSEIVELLETLLAGSSSSGSSRDRGRPPFFGGPRPGGSSSSSGGSRDGGGSATAISVGTSRTPAVLIPEAKRNWIIAKASPEQIELIGEWLEKLDTPVRTVLVGDSLASIENKNQRVQRFFNLKNYSPTQMGQVIGPLLNEDGYVSADESTRTLLVIDTVENLIRIEGIIEQFDIPEAEQTVTEIFEVRNGDPSEIVQLLRMLLSDSGSTGSSGRSNYGRSSYDRGGYSSYGRTGYSSSRSLVSSASYRGGSSRSGGSSSVIVGANQMPIVLIPDPKRGWIIARASAEAIKQISEWIDKLDLEDTGEKEYDAIPITYADVGEVADRLNEALQMMPGSEVQGSILIQAMEQARQLVVFGRQDMRDLVKKLVQEIDVPTGLFQTEHFKLKYADPDEIKEKLEELYDATSGSSSSGRYTSIYYYGSSRGSTSMSVDTVKVISYVTLKQVTVIASAENMEKVRTQIAEWDAPIDVDEVKPRIIELRNSDPVQMAELLRTLFSEEGGSGSISVIDILFGSGSEAKQKIVGPLYGQLTFEEVPGTKKIIVISKIPEAYDVIEQLIRDLDKQEMAEVPKIITLKYADPEDLSERLNAMFNEPGTSARIRLSEEGLGAYSMDEQQQDSQQQGGGGGTTDNQGSTAGTYTPWWAGSGARSTINEEMPISNVIGRIRFVPDPRTKSILVLAAPEFMEQIEQLISDLDIPGKQVLIKAIVMEVDHSKLTSLGLQVATDPASFGALNENSIMALGNLQLLEQHGALAFGAGGNAGSQVAFDAGSSVYGMIDFLVKKTNAKILNQQTLWTKDNEEAEFFKGFNIAFQTETSITDVGGRATSSYEYERVGMALQTRPSITPEKNVDMAIRVMLSQLTGDTVNSQAVRTEMDTTTNMIVQDGQTIMLGGILFQKDGVVERKIPLLGDAPLVGGLFRHNDIEASNNEMLIFITPFVIDDPNNLSEETAEEIERPTEQLREVQEELQESVEKMQQELPHGYLRATEPRS